MCAAPVAQLRRRRDGLISAQFSKELVSKLVGRAVPLAAQSLGLKSRPTYPLHHSGLTSWEPKLPGLQCGITTSLSDGCSQD